MFADDRQRKEATVEKKDLFGVTVMLMFSAHVSHDSYDGNMAGGREVSDKVRVSVERKQLTLLKEWLNEHMDQ